MNEVRLGRHAALRRLTVVLSVAYLGALALIAFWPAPVDRGVHGSLVSILAALQRHGAPGWLTYTFVEFAANIALFVPVGLLGVILVGARHWWIAIVAGLAASFCIEFGQLIFLPARFATVNDIIANTFGAGVGAVAALGVIGLTHAWPSAGPRSPTARRLHTP